MLEEFISLSIKKSKEGFTDSHIKLSQTLSDTRFINKTNQLFDEVTGAGNFLPRYGQSGYYLARIANTLKNLSSAGLLGGVSIASFGDVGTAAFRLNQMSIPFFEAHKSVLAGLIKGRRSGKIREISDSLGVGLDSLSGSIQSRWLGNDVMTGQGAEAVSWLMRVTGMNWMNDTLKTAVGLTLSNFIAKQAGKKFTDIDASLRREMESYGLLAEDFELMSSVVKEVDGKVYHDISAIDDLDAKIRINGFFTGFANSAILTPGARANLITRGERGTFSGEVKTLFMHLKSFSITYGMEILSRLFSKSNEGHRTGMAIKLLLSSIVYGYFASTVKDLAKGKEPIDVQEYPGEILLRSFMHAGGAGFYGDILIGLVGGQPRYGEGALELAGGPVLGNLSRALKIPRLLIQEDYDQAGQTAFRIAKSMLPGANLFYAKMGLDYLIFWNMSEYLNPGWARKFERRVRQETGQEYFDFARPTVAVN